MDLKRSEARTDMSVFFATSLAAILKETRLPDHKGSQHRAEATEMGRELLGFSDSHPRELEAHIEPGVEYIRIWHVEIEQELRRQYHMLMCCLLSASEREDIAPPSPKELRRLAKELEDSGEVAPRELGEFLPRLISKQ